ncbi:2-hydroxy-6-oxononadienedioate/2-hydroxy-6-oxononatrienedioate hydrolase [Hartmannibacter diazotrophicus]|uniref:2-hydroxy-6-oxononadienedioate/2-hydroxy-6-oxononatrienedioate hydrolase n=1 Tax=Hartmannibacter diazotrophicus TaxID=1482074 RepID=A0A2C9D8I2_9HYPH|nr:alpha/beta hydrolase [Hartmannibacter diazotrophicus]SON56489.1 2-hydroxy-6-oxononadienedioate/2-hydroxy-6-oxononatrienedioate hydrolase [Hartmannibacter diazotrophicus]
MFHKPVVFVPGLNCTEDLFAPQMAALSDSQAVSVAEHSTHDEIGALAGAILGFAPETFALVGLSMGGYIALEIMRQAPDRVEKLVLMDTSARGDTQEAAERRHRLIALAQAGRFAQVPDLQIPMLLGKAAQAGMALPALVRRMALATGADNFVRQQKAILSRPDSRPTLATIRCPTLVIVGEEDQITPVEVAREIASGIAGADLAVISGSGHLSSIEAPEETTAKIAAFLDRP